MKTKEKILAAARRLFMQHGLEGVRMQMVADEAGVNKGLLHYYYKTKTTIFTEIFKRVTNELFADLEEIFSDPGIESREKIDRIVDAYFNLFDKNRYLPVFFISEMNREPQILEKLGFGKKIKGLMESARPIMPDGAPDDASVHFMLTLISLSVFPFMVSPLLQQITADKNKTDELLNSRRDFVKNTLKNMLK